MNTDQANDILQAQLLRQVDTAASAAGGWNQDAATYLNAYKSASLGATVGTDQWGNSVPLFGTAAGYQRSDSTVFSAEPQLVSPPANLGVGSIADYFKGVGAGITNKIASPLNTVTDAVTNLYKTVTDGQSVLDQAAATARSIINQASLGNFTPAGQQVGEQIGTAVVTTAAGAAIGKVVGAVIPDTAETLSAANASGDMVASANLQDTLNQLASRQVEKVTAPIDFDHVIGADYKMNKDGTLKLDTNGQAQPTGSHSLVNGDVQIVPGSESAPDATGVYKANVQVVDPNNPGQWVTKEVPSQTMFPPSWTADRIKVEVNMAWENRTVNGNQWEGYTPSGVLVRGYLSPNTTAYPVYQNK